MKRGISTCTEFMGCPTNPRYFECIQYQYNMYVPWRVQIRYEKAVPDQPKYVYPYCVSGNHPGPVEQYSGPDEYQAKRDHYREDYFGMILLNALIHHPDQTVKGSGEE